MGSIKSIGKYGSYTVSPKENDTWTQAGNCDTEHNIVYQSANRTATSSFCGNDFALKPFYH